MEQRDPYDAALAAARAGCCDDRRKPCPYHEGWGDGYETCQAEAERCQSTPLPTGDGLTFFNEGGGADQVKIRIDGWSVSHMRIDRCGASEEAWSALLARLGLARVVGEDPEPGDAGEQEAVATERRERCSLTDGHGYSNCSTYKVDLDTGDTFDCTRPFHATGACEWKLRAPAPAVPGGAEDGRAEDDLTQRLDDCQRRSATTFNQLARTMQWAWAAGETDGPQAAMDVLAGFLAGPGMLPHPGADPDWYADQAWAEIPFPEGDEIPEANRTACDGAPLRFPPQLGRPAAPVPSEEPLPEGVSGWLAAQLEEAEAGVEAGSVKAEGAALAFARTIRRIRSDQSWQCRLPSAQTTCTATAPHNGCGDLNNITWAPEQGHLTADQVAEGDWFGFPLDSCADQLPTGLFRSDDGRTWWPHDAPWPAGYERRSKHGWTAQRPNTPKAGTAIEVRPVSPPPQPERVGLHELAGRFLSDHPESRVRSVGQDYDGERWSVSLHDGHVLPLPVASDGTVEVLPYSDEERG